MFIAVLLITGKARNNPNVHQQASKPTYHTAEYQSAIKQTKHIHTTRIQLKSRDVARKKPNKKRSQCTQYNSVSLWGDVLYLDYGGSYTAVYIYKNSLICTLKIDAFDCNKEGRGFCLQVESCESEQGNTTNGTNIVF